MNRSKIEEVFEACLWNFRLFTLFPVIFGLLSALNFFVIGTLDILKGISLNFCWHEEKCSEVADIIGYIIGGIDYYLIGVVLLIFSFGIYELFISRIDIAWMNEEINILEISNLDQLKHKLLQLIVIVLVVSFFKKILKMEIETTLDLFYLAFSILIIAVISYLMHAQSNFNKH